MNAKRKQLGFTMAELMIALLIGLFLIGGLLTIVFGMKRTTGNQGGLSQLQDGQRTAMNLINDVVQQAGYYPNPQTGATQASSFVGATISGQAYSAGQFILGTGAFTAAAPGDTISVRYKVQTGDKIINCLGSNYAGALASVTFVNIFSLVADATSTGPYDLACSLVIMNGTTVVSTTPATVLVTGISNMSIQYGVQTNVGSGTTSADTYLDAVAVNAGNYWGNILSVVVTLNFVNPLAGQPGQSTKPTIPFTRVIGVENR